MLDVVFILLTFFIFAMVLSKRFTVTDIRLPRSGAGASAADPSASVPGGAIVVALRPGGEVRVNDQPVTLDGLAARIAALQRETPGSAVFLAPDASAASGDLFALMDALAKAGIRDLRFLRQDQPPAQAPQRVDGPASGTAAPSGPAVPGGD